MVGGRDPGSFSLVLWVFFPFALFSNLSNYPVRFHENLVGATVVLTFTLLVILSTIGPFAHMRHVVCECYKSLHLACL